MKLDSQQIKTRRIRKWEISIVKECEAQYEFRFNYNKLIQNTLKEENGILQEKYDISGGILQDF